MSPLHLRENSSRVITFFRAGCFIPDFFPFCHAGHQDLKGDTCPYYRFFGPGRRREHLLRHGSSGREGSSASRFLPDKRFDMGHCLLGKTLESDAVLAQVNGLVVNPYDYPVDGDLTRIAKEEGTGYFVVN